MGVPETQGIPQKAIPRRSRDPLREVGRGSLKEAAALGEGAPHGGRRSLKEMGHPQGREAPIREAGFREAGLLRQGGPRMEAAPSEKRKPQRSPGHRKPGTRHQRRPPLTHRSCSAPLRAAVRPWAASGGRVVSSPLGFRGGSSFRWRPRWRRRGDRTTDYRRTN